MIIPNGFAQVNLRFTGTNVPTGAEVTFGVELLDPSDDPVDVATNAANAWDAANMQSNQTSTISLTSVYCKFGPNETGPFGEVTVAHPGTITGGATPPNTGYLVKKVTAQGGRRGAGRFTIPGVPEDSATTGGSVEASRIAAMQPDLTAFLGNLLTAGCPMRLLHAEPGFVPLDVTALQLQSRLATQRRRLRR